MKTENITNKPARKPNPYPALLRRVHACKIAGEQYKALSAELKDLMQAENRDTITAGGFTATIKEVTTSTIDWKKFITAHPELTEEIDKFRTSSITVRLYLK